MTTENEHPATCDVCLRPKASAADLARWKAEFGDKPATDPPWARALCWTKPEYRCICKPGLAPAPENRP